jgi:hypothetical protein
MIIKLTMPGQPRPADLSQFTGNHSSEHEGHLFLANSERVEADAWFVFEDADPDDAICEVPESQVHFVTAESSYPQDYFLSREKALFFSQFSEVHTCHANPFDNSQFEAPFLPWMVNANHESIFEPHDRDMLFFRGLEHLPKNRPLSILCSSRDYRPEYRLRLEFARYLKNYFREDLDWFGNGVNRIEEKWDGLAPYSRTIVLENRADRGIYTEKILDPFLSMTVPIYWGDTNVSQKLPIGREQILDIRNFRESRETIRKLIDSPVSEKDHDRLLQGKQKVLGPLHFLSRIARIAERTSLKCDSQTRRALQISPQKSFEAPEAKKVPARVGLEDRIYKALRRTPLFCECNRS